MKGVAATVIFEYGCRSTCKTSVTIKQITRCHVTGDIKHHKIWLLKTAGHDIPPHQLEHGKWGLF